MVLPTHLDRIRSFCVPGIVFAVLVAVLVCYPGGIAGAYQNATEVSKLNEEFDELYKERARLEERAVYIADRIAIKEALVEDLIAGKQTLIEVAGRFAELNSEESDAAVIRQHFPGACDLERNANNVLGYAEQRVNDPSARSHLMGKLGAEYCHHFGHPTAY